MHRLQGKSRFVLDAVGAPVEKDQVDHARTLHRWLLTPPTGK